MSLSVGASSAASQALAALLSQIDTSASASTSTSADTSSFAAPSDSAASNNSLTGSATPSLSSEVLGLLTQMRQMEGSASGGSSAASSSTGISSLTLSSLAMSSLTLSSTNPMQQLFAAMDSNDGDDSVSESANASGSSSGSADFAQTWESLQDQGVAQGSSMISMLDTLSKLDSTNTATSSVTA